MSKSINQADGIILHKNLLLYKLIFQQFYKLIMRAFQLSLQKYFSRSFDKTLYAKLSEFDPEVTNIVKLEEKRQTHGLNLIASENHCSQAVLQSMSTVMNSKYSEGYPGQRYYGGTQYVDQMEILCQKRALEAFRLNPKEWGVNVQSLSGSPANFEVYTALLNPHDRILSLDLPHGGHLSHGYQTPQKKISAVSKYFQVLPYRLNQNTGLLDYDSIEYLAKLYRPKLIVAGASAYSRLFDYSKFRSICDSINAYLLADISHPAGLMAAGVIPGPFDHADVVTTTTHKTLRATRGALIFYRVGTKKDKKGNQTPLELKSKIDQAVFPGHQGGPHNHTITAIAVGLKDVTSPQFKKYQQKVLANSQILAKKLIQKGYNLVSGGTDNHLLLIDLRSQQIDGARVEAVCNQILLFVNKNTVPGDKSALTPHGLRLGSPSLTTRGLDEKDFEQVAQFVHRAIVIAKDIKKKTVGTKLVDFKNNLENSKQAIDGLRADIQKFAVQFPVPGIN